MDFQKYFTDTSKYQRVVDDQGRFWIRSKTVRGPYKVTAGPFESADVVRSCGILFAKVDDKYGIVTVRNRWLVPPIIKDSKAAWQLTHALAFRAKSLKDVILNIVKSKKHIIEYLFTKRFEILLNLIHI